MLIEVENWWRQAEEDLDSAKFNYSGGKYYVCAFLCQQAVEKALKALYILQKERLFKTHNLLRLARDLNFPEGLLKKISTLEPVYQETRYPDVSKRIPAEEFTKEAAFNFVNITEEVLGWIKKRMK